jgi:ABC-type uncharacterized transport system permease subunit
MNAFNRTLVILLDLVLLAGAVAVLLVTFGVLTPAQLLLGGLAGTVVGPWLTSFATMPPNATLLTTAVALVVILIGLVLLIAELRPERPPRTLTIRQDGLGSVTVRMASVRDLIAYTAAQIPAVLQVQPDIAATSQGLQIRCRAALSPEASIPQVSSQLQGGIKQAVEQHLGMKVAQVAVQAQLEPLPGAGSGTPRTPPRRQLR